MSERQTYNQAIGHAVAIIRSPCLSKGVGNAFDLGAVSARIMQFSIKQSLVKPSMESVLFHKTQPSL